MASSPAAVFMFSLSTHNQSLWEFGGWEWGKVIMMRKALISVIWPSVNLNFWIFLFLLVSSNYLNYVRLRQFWYWEVCSHSRSVLIHHCKSIYCFLNFWVDMECNNILNPKLENFLNILDLTSIHIYIYIRLYTHRDTNFIKDQERLINTSEDLNSFLIRNQWARYRQSKDLPIEKHPNNKATR